MQNFTYYSPTKIVFGKGKESEAGQLIKQLGFKKALVLYGGKSAQESGLLDRVTGSLKINSITYEMLGGDQPNPILSHVYEGVKLCKELDIDFILAVGGGSVIDSAKAIGCGAVSDRDVWDFFSGLAEPASCLPIGAVVTVAAAGSEVSNVSIITNDHNSIKKGLHSDHIIPKFAIMNPELTVTMPPNLTACGIVDILMHTMERYFTTDSTLQLTDNIAEALMRTVIKNGKILMEDPTNYQARAEMMWAGSLSHNNLTGCGSTGDWSTHEIQLALGSLADIPHGYLLSSLWGSWARYVYLEKPERFARFAIQVLEIEAKANHKATALAGIEAMEAFYRSLGMPISIEELGLEVEDQDAEMMADRLSQEGEITLGGFKKLGKEDIKAILLMAR